MLYRSYGLSAVVFALALVASVGAEAKPASGDAANNKGGKPPSDATRIAAATTTAQSGANACALIRPFFWEIGDRSARLASGSVTAVGNTTTYTATTPMGLASASKWIYSAYVAQRTGGAISEFDRKFLSMLSGYVSLANCSRATTVDGCLAELDNGRYTAEADGRFDYNGGHMQKHASLLGLGSMDNKTLATTVRSQIGTDLAIAYSQPQPAAGAVASPDTYAKFLRKILSGSLQIGALLGSGPACTSPYVCGLDEALYTPIPSDENWHYSLGHWVEDDPVIGDGAFSSPGALGFYPWINGAKTHYGIVARVIVGDAPNSVNCGRSIRKAWATGVAQ